MERVKAETALRNRIVIECLMPQAVLATGMTEEMQKDVARFLNPRDKKDKSMFVVTTYPDAYT